MKNGFKLVSLAAMCSAAVMGFAQSDIPVTVNGDPVHFHGHGPVMSQDRVLVPLRGVLERMGATVDWDPSSQTIRAEKSGTHVKLQIGENSASVNGQQVNLDVPATIIDGTTMVPLRFIGEALGENVRWNEQAQAVEISTGDYQMPRDNGSRPQVMRMPRMIRAGSVINATLTESISSDSNQQGDKVMADVNGGTLGLPEGTQLEGVVQAVRPRMGDRAGWLNIRFTKLILPNGNTYPVSGTFMGRGKVSTTWVHNAHFDSGTTFGVQLTNSIRFNH
jgi:hypothetical protein